MKKFITTMILAFSITFVTSPVQAKELSLKEATKASCRITVVKRNQFNLIDSLGYGTGTVIKDNDSSYYVLTNGHVVTDKDTKVYLQFFKDGFVSLGMPGKVIWRTFVAGSSLDVALVEVEKKHFGSYKPIIIPLAKEGYEIKTGSKIFGAGVPQGKWMQAWEARILKVNKNTIRFNMPPVGGQSGSAILQNIDGHTRVIGTVNWRHGNNALTAWGAGVHLQRIYDIFTLKAEKDTLETSFQSPIPTQAEIRVEARHGVNHDHRCKYCGRLKKDHYVRHTGEKVELKKLPNGEWSTQVYCAIPPALSGFKISTYGQMCPPRPSPPANPWINNRPPIRTPVPDLAPPVNPEPDNKSPDIFPDDSEDNKDDNSQLIEDLTLKLKSKDAELEQANEEKETLRKRVEDLLNKINIPYITNNFGQTGTVIFGLIAAIMSGTLGATVWQKVAVPMLVKRFGWFPSKLITFVLERRSDKFREIFKKKVDIPEESGYNINSDVDVAKGGDTTTFNDNSKTFWFNYSNSNEEKVEKKDDGNDFVIPIPTPEPKPEPPKTEPEPKPEPKPDKPIEDPFKKDQKLSPGDLYVKSLFDTDGGKYMGQSPKHWAIKYALYKEAVEKLKRGEFTHKGKTNLLGQQQTAEAIESWVDNEFYNRVSKTYDEDEIPSVYRNAFMGILYFQAIQQLENGGFGTLGSEAIAEAITTWVIRQFNSRYGV